MLDFKDLLDRQGVPPEMMRGTIPLDMNQVFFCAEEEEEEEEETI